MCMRAEAIRPRERSLATLALGFGLKCLVRIVTDGREPDSGKQINALTLRYSDTTFPRGRGRGRRRVRERMASIPNPHT